MTYEAFIAAYVTIAAVQVLFTRWDTFWRDQFEDVAEPVHDRPDVVDFIHDPLLRIANTEMPPYLFDRALESYTQIDGGMKDLDSKASSILGFLGGGIGLFALVSQGKILDGPHPSWMMLVAIAALFGAVLSAIASLRWRRRRGIPKVIDWANPLVTGDPFATKARLALYAALVYSDRIYSVRKINIAKAYFLELSQWLFAFGALVLLVNVGVGALGKGDDKEQSSTVTERSRHRRRPARRSTARPRKDHDGRIRRYGDFLRDARRDIRSPQKSSRQPQKSSRRT